MSKCGYRLLEEGEVIQDGDEYLGLGEAWWKIKDDYPEVIGKEVIDDVTLHRRPITKQWLKEELKRLED
jgi:hypothetical protein